MKTTAFDIDVATIVENAVMEIYNCKRHDIHQFKDSEVKKLKLSYDGKVIFEIGKNVNEAVG